VMQLPGRMDTQRALVWDYGNYVAQFAEIAAYLARWQPPSLMVWGRHDPFFDLAEILSWMRALPRMLMLDFIRRTQLARGTKRE
jgi:hypothetical protein